MFRSLTVSALLCVIGLYNSSASAAVIVPGNIPEPGEENILFNQPGLISTGVTIQGITNQTAVVVNFTGDGEIITTPAQGQARIEAVDGSLDFLSIRLAPPGGTFGDIILNLNAEADGFVTFTVDEGSGPVLFPTVFNIDAGGQNFFTATSALGFLSFSFQTSGAVSAVGLDDVRQIRISQVRPNAGVPEVSSIAAWAVCIGMGAMVYLRRKRTRFFRIT
jgi:hypothetical protein